MARVGRKVFTTIPLHLRQPRAICPAHRDAHDDSRLLQSHATSMRPARPPIFVSRCTSASSLRGWRIGLSEL